MASISKVFWTHDNIDTVAKALCEHGFAYIAGPRPEIEKYKKHLDTILEPYEIKPILSFKMTDKDFHYFVYDPSTFNPESNKLDELITLIEETNG